MSGITFVLFEIDEDGLSTNNPYGGCGVVWDRSMYAMVHLQIGMTLKHAETEQRQAIEGGSAAADEGLLHARSLLLVRKLPKPLYMYALLYLIYDVYTCT